MTRLLTPTSIILFACSLGMSPAKTAASESRPVRSDASSPEKPRTIPTTTGDAVAASIRIFSDISECLTVGGLRKLNTEENLLIAEVTLTTLKSIGSCGCVSSSLVYRSFESYRDFEMELASGVLSGPTAVRTPAVRRIVLTADGVGRRQGLVKIHIGCRPPQ